MTSIGPNTPPPNESTYLVSSKKISIPQRLKNLFIYLFQKIGINFAQHSKFLPERASIFNPLQSTLEPWTSSAQKTNILLYRINDNETEPVFELQNVDILTPQKSDTLATIQIKLKVLKNLEDSKQQLTPESKKKLAQIVTKVSTKNLQEKLDAFSSIESNYYKEAYRKYIFSDFSENIESICRYCLFNPQKVRTELETLIKTNPQQMHILLPLLKNLLVPAVINNGDFTNLTRMTEKQLKEKIEKEHQQAQANMMFTPDYGQTQGPARPSPRLPEQRHFNPQAFIQTSNPKAPTPTTSAPTTTPPREYTPMARDYDSTTAQQLFLDSSSNQTEYLKLCSANFTKTSKKREKALKDFAQQHPQAFKQFLALCSSDIAIKNAFTYTWFDQDSTLFFDFKSFVEKLEYPRSSSFYPSPVSYNSSIGALPSDSIENLDEFYKNQLTESEKQNIRQGTYTISQEIVEDRGWRTRPYIIRDNQGEVIKILNFQPNTPEQKKPSREDWS